MVDLVTYLSRLPRTLRRLWESRLFRGLVVVTAVTLLLGTLFYWRVEGWSVLDSFYFCALTLATVGGGDLAPDTMVGEAFTILIALAGLGILSGFIYVVVKSTLDDRRGRYAVQRRSRAERPPSEESDGQ